MIKQSMIPYLTVKNTQETIKFYRDVFGFTHMPNNDGESPEHAEMEFQNTVLCSALKVPLVQLLKPLEQTK